MKKVLFVMLASVFVVASLSLAACGDDDDDSSFDNQAACQNLEDTINGLECLPEGWTDLDMMCDSYAETTTCDVAPYFDCIAECYSCDGDTLVYDADKAAGECMDIWTEMAEDCGA